jgi:plasmid segregation protein ParM
MANVVKLNFVVGNDNGNSEHDILIAGALADGMLIQSPNVNCQVDSIPWSEGLSPESFIPNLQDQLVVTIASPTVNGMYYVGQFALDSGEVVNNMQVGIDYKHEVDLPVINTLAHIAAKAVQDYYVSKKKVPTAIDVEVDMTTCLPVIQFTQEAAQAFETRFNQGIHTVLVHLGRTTVNVKIEFSFVKVIPEATPVIFTLQSDDYTGRELMKEFVKENYDPEQFIDDGSEPDVYFEDKRILHCDIGDGTTEYPVTEGEQFLRQFMLGSNHGAGHAIEEALNDFNRLIHIPDSPRQFLSDVVKNPNHKYYKRAMQVLQRPLHSQAQQIAKNILKQLSKTRNEIDIICVYGGGSILMRPYLYDALKKICSEREIKLFYVPQQHAVTLGVLGLYSFTEGPIFKALKERANG